VPQLAGVFGDCIAGGGYMPIISDRVYMTEQAYMVIAGAALIKGAKSAEDDQPRHRRPRGARAP
jgi:3-methylcrotonyl-CoA carboxylase beta subunit